MKETIFYLYFVIAGYGSSPNFHRTQIGSEIECLRLLKQTKISISNGAESEYLGAAFCAPKDFQMLEWIKGGKKQLWVLKEKVFRDNR